MKASSLLLFILVVISVTRSDADITVEFTEFADAGLVMVSATGSLDTTGLPLMASAFGNGGVSPDDSILRFSDPGGSASKMAFVATGMPDFGLDTLTVCDYFAGDVFGFETGRYAVPSTYESGEPISSTIVFLGASLSSLGIDVAGAPFTATLTTGDTITIKIVELIDEARLQALETQFQVVGASSGEQERKLKRKIKKLSRKLRAAKRRAR